MKPPLRIKTQVLPGNKVEIEIPEAVSGEAIELLVIFLEKPQHPPCSAIDIIKELPGKRLFKTPEEVDKYLQEERDSGDR